MSVSVLISSYICTCTFLDDFSKVLYSLDATFWDQAAHPGCCLFVLCLFVIMVVYHFGFEDRTVVRLHQFLVIITQTRPCNIQQYFTDVKMLIFR